MNPKPLFSKMDGIGNGKGNAFDYSGSPEPVNPIFRATCSDWQSRSE